MKKLSCFIMLLLLTALAGFAQISQGSTAWVSARTVTLKSSTGWFASNRGTVAYGDQVSVLRVSGNWAEVRSGTLTGWMNHSNLSARRIVPSPSTGGATASEVALAGKGFDRDIENAYRAGANLNYADVDRTEAIRISQDELFRFVSEGRLAMGEE